MNVNKGFVALGAALVCAGVLAHDANTTAFYAFKEGADGESALGKAITNDVDAAKFLGTPAVMSSASFEGQVLFSDDAPAKYVFAGKAGSLVCTDPKSLKFNGELNRKATTRTGGNVSFEGLGAELSRQDTYTLEFFWKIDPGEYPGYETNMLVNAFIRAVKWHAGNIGASGTACPIGLNLLESKKAIRLWSGPDGGDVNTSAVSVLYDYSDTHWLNQDRTLVDGKWHHIAVTHIASNGQTRVWADYCVPDHKTRQGTSLVATNVQLTASEPLELGAFFYRGKIACLRISKKVLDVSQYLYVSESPYFYPDYPTVFHWRLDGENGTAAGVLKNALPAYRDINTNIFYGTDSAIVSTNYNGDGTAYTDANAAPVYTDEIPRSGHMIVQDGVADDAPHWINSGSVYMNPTAATSPEEWMIGAPGLTAPVAQHRFVTNGSFTCECFVRIDRQDFLAKNKVTHYPRAGIMGSWYPSYYFDWKLFFDYETASGEMRMRPQLQAYYLAAGSGTPTLKAYIYNDMARGTFLDDENWHHVAVVYDDSTYTFKVYFDYADTPMIVTLTQPFVSLSSGSYRQFRYGYGLNDQTLQGAFDEVRVSRVALAPSQFLRHRPRPGAVVILR